MNQTVVVDPQLGSDFDDNDVVPPHYPQLLINSQWIIVGENAMGRALFGNVLGDHLVVHLAEMESLDESPRRTREWLDPVVTELARVESYRISEECGDSEYLGAVIKSLEEIDPNLARTVRSGVANKTLVDQIADAGPRGKLSARYSLKGHRNVGLELTCCFPANYGEDCEQGVGESPTWVRFVPRTPATEAVLVLAQLPFLHEMPQIGPAALRSILWASAVLDLVLEALVERDSDARWSPSAQFRVVLEGKLLDLGQAVVRGDLRSWHRKISAEISERVSAQMLRAVSEWTMTTASEPTDLVSAHPTEYGKLMAVFAPVLYNIGLGGALKQENTNAFPTAVLGSTPLPKHLAISKGEESSQMRSRSLKGDYSNPPTTSSEQNSMTLLRSQLREAYRPKREQAIKQLLHEDAGSPVVEKGESRKHSHVPNQRAYREAFAEGRRASVNNLRPPD